jgi:hypothetical protein
VVVGVVVSVATSVAIVIVLPGATSRGISVVGGLIVGSLATGSIVHARTPRQWINAALLTLAGQFLVGVVLALLVMR